MLTPESGITPSTSSQTDAPSSPDSSTAQRVPPSEAIMRQDDVTKVQLINSRFTKRYAIAVFVGVVPVFVSAQLWWMTIVAMVVFLAIGYEDARKSGMVYEFADAFYYLGFTLSIGTLLAALDPFHVGVAPDVKVTFHLFGLGMFTTLIGVTGRTLMQS